MPDAAWAARWLSTFEAGVMLTPQVAMQVPAVFGCVSRIANAIAPHPWNVYAVDGRARDLRPDDPVAYLLSKRPNPSTTAVAFRQAMLRACLAGDGNSYAEIQFDNAGRPVALWPLEPDRVTTHSTPDGALYYTVYQYTGGSVDVEPWRIFHLRGLASVNGLVGDGPLFHASKAIAIASAAQQFAASYYANGTISSGVLKHPKRVDPKAIERLRGEWLENHAGPAAAHKPLFLEDGMDWQSITVDAEKSQLHESRAFSVEEIARYFGVPLHLLGVAQSAQGYGTNVEQLGIEFVRYTLKPWAAALQQEADAKLFPARAPWRETRIDLSELTHGDEKTKAETLVVLKKGGIISQNEAREELGRNTVGSSGDIYMVESVMKTIDQLVNPPPTPAPTLPAPAADPGSAPAPKSLVREAAEIILGDALDAHAKVFANRRADLGPGDRLNANLSAERERQRPRLFDRCAGAIDILRRSGVDTSDASSDLVAIAAAVEDGEPARLAAVRFIAKFTEAT